MSCFQTPLPMMIYNVGDISTYVTQQLHCYDKKIRIKETVALPNGMKFSDYVLRQWYVFALDHMVSLNTSFGQGWCAPDEEITRFALRKTNPEMEMLYRTLRVPEKTWCFNGTLAIRLESRGRDLHLEYVPNRLR